MKCCDIAIGDLRHKVSLQRKSLTSDGVGGSVVAWTEYATPYAKIKPKSGGEKIYLNRLNASGLSTVVMRYRDDVQESDKLVFRGDEYQIRSVINVEERDRYTELTIERGVAQ